MPSSSNNQRWRIAANRPTRDDMLAQTIAEMAFRIAEQTRAIIEAGAMEELDMPANVYMDGTQRR